MKYSLFLFFIFIIGSCNNIHFQKEEAILKEYLKQSDLDELGSGKSVLLFISSDGCAYCINESLLFAKNNNHKENLKVIFSYPKRVKVKLQAIGIQEHDKGYVIDDGNSRRKGLVLDEPTVYYVDNGKIFKIEKINPNNMDEIFYNILSY
jgi:hypothetical protein